MNTSQPKRIFISYKRADKERVLNIKNNIEQTTSVKCWIDLDGIESSAAFRKVIIDAIKECDVFLFMYSKIHSQIVDSSTDWSMLEIDYAKRKNKRIVIIKLDDVEYFDEFDFTYGCRQYVNAFDDAMMKRLYVDLQGWLTRTQDTTEDTQRLQAEQAILAAEQAREKAEAERCAAEKARKKAEVAHNKALLEQQHIKKELHHTCKEQNRKQEVTDKLASNFKKINGKSIAKGTAVVMSGLLLGPVGVAAAGSAIVAKKLWDKKKRKK
jgi:hypothetical protein